MPSRFSAFALARRAPPAPPDLPDDWKNIHATLAQLPPGSRVRVPPQEDVPGARRSVGLPKGQIRDWRFPPDVHCRGLHVQLFPKGRLEAHLDAVHPSCGVFQHVAADAPGMLYLICGGAGALLGGTSGFTISLLLARLLHARGEKLAKSKVGPDGPKSDAPVGGSEESASAGAVL